MSNCCGADPKKGVKGIKIVSSDVVPPDQFLLVTPRPDGPATTIDVEEDKKGRPILVRLFADIFKVKGIKS